MNFYGNNYISKNSEADLSTQYTLDLLGKMQLKNQEMIELFSYCKQKRLLHFCTPLGYFKCKILNECNVPLFKVASADFN